MPDKSADRRLDDLLARAEIHELLCNYMRGQDRLDAALHRSVFHDDATTNYGFFKGGPDDLSSQRHRLRTL